MPGTVTRQQQVVQPTPGTTIQQGAGSTSGVTSFANGTELPYLFLADEYNPDRRVSPGLTPVQPSVTGVTAAVAGTAGGASVVYSVVGVCPNGDTVPTAAAGVLAPSPTTDANYVTVTWTPQDGLVGYRVLKAGALLATVVAGVSSYTDNAGLATMTYVASTVNPPAQMFVTDPDTRVSGTITANSGSISAPAAGSTVAVAYHADGIVGIQISGTWVATLAFEATTDGTNWFPVNGVQSVTGAQVSQTTANGQWRANAGGYQAVRVRATAYTSGTATVALLSSDAGSMATLAEPLPAGTNTIGAVTGPPASSPTGVVAAITGMAGGTGIVYSVVAVFPTGDTLPTAAASVLAPSPTSVANYVTTTWALVQGAIGYRVLKAGALLSGLLSAYATSYVDNAALGTTAYTPATANPLGAVVMYDQALASMLTQGTGKIVVSNTSATRAYVSQNFLNAGTDAVQATNGAVLYSINAQGVGTGSTSGVIVDVRGYSTLQILANLNPSSTLNSFQIIVDAVDNFGNSGAGLWQLFTGTAVTASNTRQRIEIGPGITPIAASSTGGAAAVLLGTTINIRVVVTSGGPGGNYTLTVIGK